jgi:EAL domain-containing protein (putative c-di-GMP-specific phosphodiesterase class I)
VQVVAEYVETAAQRDLLRDLGCHWFQGWLYSRALPAGEMAAYALGHGGQGASPALGDSLGLSQW